MFLVMMIIDMIKSDNSISANIINIVFNSTNISLHDNCKHQYRDYKDIHLIKINTFTQSDLLSCLELGKEGWLYQGDIEGFVPMLKKANVISSAINQRLAELKKCTEIFNREKFQEFEKDDFQKLQKEGNVRKQSEQSIKNNLHTLENKDSKGCSDMHWSESNIFLLGCFNKELRKDIIKEIADPTVEHSPFSIETEADCGWVD